MKDSKLAKLLQLLDNKDLRQIQKMLQSPFFTTKESLLKLFTILRKYHPQFDHKKLEKESLFQKLFFGEKYSDVKVRGLFSDLNKIIEDYLIIQKLKNDDMERRELLLNIYVKKSRYVLFMNESTKVESDIQSSPYKDSIFYKKAYEYNMLKLEMQESKVPKERYEILLDSLRLMKGYYHLSAIKIKSELQSFKGFAAYEEQELSPLTGNIIYILYQKLNQLYLEKNMALFQEIKNILIKNLNFIRKEFQLEFLTHLINFCLGMMKQDDVKYNIETLDLYKIGLNHNILTQHNRITDNSFLNIVISGSKAKEFDFVKDFISEYKDYLNKDIKPKLSKLARSFYHFYKREIEEAIDLIMDISFSSPFRNASARLHLLRCYYELFDKDISYFEMLISQCIAFEKMVKRNPNYSRENVDSYINFSKFIRLLSKTKASGELTKDQKKRLIDYLDQQKIVKSRSWLIQKING